MSQEQIVEQSADEAQAEQSEFSQMLETAKIEAADYKDRWVRSVAEFNNYRKRTEREWSDVRASAGSEVIKTLLPVLDDLALAFKAVPPDLQSHAWLEGFRLIERKFMGVLEQNGVSPIETVGQMFDPNLHESVASEESDQPHGTILEEYRRGYRMNDKVLRPAMVKIAQ